VTEDMPFLPIGGPEHFPDGWQRAAKGRTVWRIAELAVLQNLKRIAESEGLVDFTQAETETHPFDFHCRIARVGETQVNLKTYTDRARKGGNEDVSKALRLLDFMQSYPEVVLLLASVKIEFHDDPFGIQIGQPSVVPLAWLGDIYVNGSSNKNLMTASARRPDACIERSHAEFRDLVHARALACGLCPAA
jgi:hypothetical protein